MQFQLIELKTLSQSIIQVIVNPLFGSSSLPYTLLSKFRELNQSDRGYIDPKNILVVC